MKVRVKEGKTYYYGDRLYLDGDTFEIKDRNHSITGDVISVESQFSDICMEKVEVARKPGRPAKKEKTTDS